MNDHKGIPRKDLRVFRESPGTMGTAVFLLAFFLICVGAGAILHMMTTSAGRGWLGHILIWVPLVLLLFYISRAVRSYRRLPQQSDFEFSERLRLRLEEEALLKKEPAPEKAPAQSPEISEEVEDEPTSPEPPPSSPSQ